MPAWVVAPIGIVLGAIIKASWDIAIKADDKSDARKEACSAVVLHLRRMIALIDGLEAYVRFGMKPGLEHVRMVRGVLAEHTQHAHGAGHVNA